MPQGCHLVIGMFLGAKALCRVHAPAERPHHTKTCEPPPFLYSFCHEISANKLRLGLDLFEHIQGTWRKPPANAKGELTWSRRCSVRSFQEDLRLLQFSMLQDKSSFCTNCAMTPARTSTRLNLLRRLERQSLPYKCTLANWPMGCS